MGDNAKMTGKRSGNRLEVMRDFDDGHLWGKPNMPRQPPPNKSSSDGLRPPTGKRERQTSDNQASAPMANDGNDGNNDGENSNGKWRGNRLPWATKMSDAMATNNGGDGGCGGRDSGDGAQGWLLEKGMNEGKRQRQAQRG